MHTYGNFSGYPCNRITRSFRSKCRRTRNPRINFNKIILEWVRVKCKLNIASALNFKFTDNAKCRITKHLIFLIRKCLARADHHRVTCMNTDRVDIFHITNCDSSIICITHYFVFDFLIAFNTLFHKYLMNRWKCKSIFHHNHKFFFIIGKATACTAKCKCRAKNNRESYFSCSFKSVFKIFCNLTRKNRFAEAFTKLFEKLSVLRSFNSVKISTEYFNITFFKYAFFSKLNCKVEAGLTAEWR